MATSFVVEGPRKDELNQWNDLYGEGHSRIKYLLNCFRLWHVTSILDLLPFILNDTFKLRNESFTIDGQKLKHGYMSHYIPNVTEML